MSESGPISDHMLVFTLLQRLIRTASSSSYCLADHNLLKNGHPIPPSDQEMSDEELEARSLRLANRLGIPGLVVSNLAWVWRSALRSENPPDRGMLIELARSSVPGQEQNRDAIALWRRALELRMLRLRHDFRRVERLKELPAAQRSGVLESGPFLEDWPRRLLEAPEWAAVESPLPGLPQLGLDDVWVDLRFIDPHEIGAPSAIEDFFQALEHRYRERLDLSQPSEFVLEQLHDSAILAGAPGSGKTTLLKWLARRLIQEPGGRFLLPLFVPLREYILKKRLEPPMDMMDFGLRMAGLKDREQRERWSNLLAYLSGTARNNVLFLLDGWDEVPLEDRELLAMEIRDLGYGYSFLLTSRPAAFPQSLPITRVYEICDLSSEGVARLIQRWFGSLGASRDGAELLDHLDAHPDLRRLARNPFLLTLICGLHHRARRLPHTRTELYREAVDVIRAHHTSRYPRAPFNAERLQSIERLSLWLFTGAQDAPRYVFDDADVREGTGDTTVLEEVLKPSRLLSQWELERGTFHFIHTTFQEYLAARFLHRSAAQRGKGAIDGIGSMDYLLQQHVHEAGWQEILRFMAGTSRNGDTLRRFWAEMKRQARDTDRFGLVTIRLAGLVAETQATDGGRAVLEIDLRDLLWELIVGQDRTLDHLEQIHIDQADSMRYSAGQVGLQHYLDAFAELDVSDLMTRVASSLPQLPSRTQARLLRALRQIRTAQTARILVGEVLGDDPKAAAVAMYQLQPVLDADGLNRLLEALETTSTPLSVRKRVVRAIGLARRHESLDRLARVTREEPELAAEAIRALGRLASEGAVAQLGLSLREASVAPRRADVIAALGDCRVRSARDVLLDELASLDSADPDVPTILEALSELPIHQGFEMVVGLLERGARPELRAAAASALEAAVGTGIVDALMSTARSDEAMVVRTAALAALRRRARPCDASDLKTMALDGGLPPAARANALRALLEACARFARQDDGAWMQQMASKLVLEVLETPNGELALEASAGAFLVGASTAPRLTELVVDKEASAGVREFACTSLGRLKYEPAAYTLLAAVRAEPNADIDDDRVQLAVSGRIARAAAEALTHIAPGLLLSQPGQTAHIALGEFAFRTGALVFAEHIVDARGRVVVDLRQREVTAEERGRMSLPVLRKSLANAMPAVDMIRLVAGDAGIKPQRID